MTPEQVGLLSAIIGVLEKLSSWPGGLTLVALLVGPWVLSLVLAHSERARLETVVKMYQDNVELVKAFRRVADDQKDVIILNTQQWMAVREAVENNLFCPMIRLEKKVVSPGGTA